MFDQLHTYRKTTVVSPSELEGKLLVVKILEYIPVIKTKVAKNGVPGIRCNVFVVGETPELDEAYFNVLWTHKTIVQNLMAFTGTAVCVRIVERRNAQGQPFLTLETPSRDDLTDAEGFISDNPQVFATTTVGGE